MGIFNAHNLHYLIDSYENKWMKEWMIEAIKYSCV